MPELQSGLIGSGIAEDLAMKMDTHPDEVTYLFPLLGFLQLK